VSASAGTATLAVDCRCTLGEGIVWCERRGALLWTDIEGRRLWMHVHSGSVTHNWRLPDRLGSFALGESGTLLLGLAKGLAVGDLDAATHDDLSRQSAEGATADLPVTPLVAVEPDLPTRINDGRTDRAGNFVFGTMSEDHTARIGSFYQYSSRHALRRLDLDHVTIANSICFSPDGGTLYFCDSPRRRIMQCDYDADSARVSHVREFADLASHAGFPDGSTVDADGGLWNAEWGASMVRRYMPEGSVDRHMAVPVKNPSCVAFGGPNLDGLYITSARQQMTPQELEAMPHAGGVYRVVPGDRRGLPESRFSDR
jgi:sugar lactone lactonase YvrE